MDLSQLEAITSFGSLLVGLSKQSVAASAQLGK
jgi:hypothetical protein